MTLPNLKFKSSPNYSARNGKVRLIVVHDCEGSFGGSVSWFAEPQSKVSAHIVLSEDGTQAIQMVHWANKAWHACVFNSASEGIESAGFAAKGLAAAEWLSLASIVAFRLRANGLPCVYAEGGIGSGFCQHVDLGVPGGGHHDISSDKSVWDNFVRLVQTEYSKPPQSWNIDTSPIGELPPPPADWKPVGDTRHDLAIGSIHWIQMELNARKLKGVDQLNVDGLDGPKTRQAVAAFQESIGLHSDGEAGKFTIAALQKAA